MTDALTIEGPVEVVHVLHDLLHQILHLVRHPETISLYLFPSTQMMQSKLAPPRWNFFQADFFRSSLPGVQTFLPQFLCVAVFVAVFTVVGLVVTPWRYPKSFHPGGKEEEGLTSFQAKPSPPLHRKEV